MTTRSRGPLAGFGWLLRGIGVGFRHPRPLFGAAALLLLVCLLPTLVTLPMRLHAIQAGTPPSASQLGWVMAGSTLLGLLLMPLYAGLLQVVDAAERGLPARARDIFAPYRQGGGALRLIGFGLAVLLVYGALLAAVVAASGGGLAHWYLQTLTAQVGHQPAVALPEGFMTAMALLILLGLFMMGFYAIALGQVALGRRGVFGAIGDGLVGALKNVLPLVAFALGLVLAWIVVALGFALAGVLLALLGKLVGTWLVFVLMVPLYVALLFVVFTAMFGAMYHLWRDVCGGDAAPMVAASTPA